MVAYRNMNMDELDNEMQRLRSRSHYDFNVQKLVAPVMFEILEIKNPFTRLFEVWKMKRMLMRTQIEHQECCGIVFDL